MKEVDSSLQMSDASIWLIYVIITMALTDGTDTDRSLTLSNTELTDIKALYHEYCPFTSLCTVESTLTLNRPLYQRPCCTQCSCEDGCEGTKSCCFDKPGLNATMIVPSEQERVCTSNYVMGPTQLHLTSHYFMVQSCPTTESNSILRIPCLNPSFQNLSTIVPVSSNDSETIYRNKYCAICNGVASYLIWNIVMLNNFNSFKLFKDKEFNSSEEVVQFAMKYSHLETPSLSFPPDGISNPYSACREGTTQTCPTGTNQSKEFNLTITACETVQSDFLGYPNIFCFICNNPDQDVSRYSVCPKTKDRSRMAFASRSFASLLTFEQTTSTNAPVDRNSEEGCNNAEVFDIYQRRCRSWFCPTTTSLKGDNCEPVLRHVFGVSVTVPFAITVYTNATFIMDDWVNIATHIEAWVAAILHRRSKFAFVFTQNSTKCLHAPASTSFIGLCVIIIEPGEDAFTVYPNLTIQLKHVAGAMTVMVRNISMNIRFDLGPDYIYTGIRYDSAVKEYYDDIDNVYFAYYNFQERYMIAFQKTLYCKQIKLNSTEYKRIGNSICPLATAVCLTKMDYQTVDGDAGAVRICLEDYMMSSVSSRATMDSPMFRYCELVLVFVCILFCF